MRKKALFIYLMIIALMFNTLGLFANGLILRYDGGVHTYRGNIYSLKVNNELIVSDMPPIIMNDRSLVPVRAIFEKLGASVEWDASARRVSVSYNEMEVELIIDDYYALVNGNKEKMEVPAKIINDRTMVPLRFVGEQLNMNVGWHPDRGEITIDSYDLQNLAQLKDIRYTKNNSEYNITMSLDKNQGYKIQRISNPDRIVVDFPNTQISGVQSNIDVSSDFVKSIRTGQFDAGTARVVLDVADKPKYGIINNGDNLILNVSRGNNIGNSDNNLSNNELDIHHIVDVNYEVVVVETGNYNGYKYFDLDNPYRIVIDIPGAKIPEKLQRMNVNSQLVNSIRCAESNEGYGRVVIDTAKEPYYKVVEENGLLVIYISKSPITGEPKVDIPLITRSNPSTNPQLDNLLSVNYINRGNYEEVELKINDYSDYIISKENDNNTIVVEIPNALSPIRDQIVNVSNSKLIEELTFVSYKVTSSKVFINLKDISRYIVSEENGRLVFTVMEDDYVVDDGKVEIPNEDEKDQIIEPEPDDDDDDSYLLNRVSVVYENNQDHNKVMIGLNSYNNYSISRISNPDRIVIDIPNAYVTEESTINVRSSHINLIRYAQFEKRTARVVIEVPSGAQYRVEELNSRLDIYVNRVEFKNIAYYGNMDRVHFILNGAKLTEGGEDLRRLYKGTYDLDGKRYTITFPSHLADIGTGIMYINDNIVEYIRITQNKSTNETSIEFNTREKYHFEIITRGNLNDTAINLLKPASKADRLVVIDPGHGGRDPGAVHGGMTEKELNLDISLRLNELLKSKGVKTYMIREDDRYVGLYERAYIANSLNASLFLSIHNNAFHSQHKGTETLYFPPRAGDTGFNGKRFAEIIQHNVVTKLNTNNRRIIERPGLVVLRATKMPAALAEIAFMTNSEDMARLKSEEFRQRAAEALCDSVLQALSEMD
ncbi:UNVERIFIED_CONTAM: N-acetylmuramoyl-L-alanine amidase [Acetivibrio alkalicellulosi]